MDKNELTELARQLSNPSGQKGVELGKLMNESNKRMISKTIDFLNIKDNFSVLELGHGNCGHLSEILNSASNIKYIGLETSKTMCEQASESNKNEIAQEQAEFITYNGEILPFENEMFERILTVNTLYFWTEPEKLMKEIERVLKAGGSAVITFAEKKFMESLPFVSSFFTLYDEKDFQKLLETTNLKLADTKIEVETVNNKIGELVERKFIMMKIEKAAGKNVYKKQ